VQLHVPVIPAMGDTDIGSRPVQAKKVCETPSQWEKARCGGVRVSSKCWWKV
jgi:hypothetical protein